MKQCLSQLANSRPLLALLVGFGCTAQITLAQTSAPDASPDVSPDASPPATPPIVLGQPSGNAYVVAIPTTRLELLEQVQQYAPLAFFTDSRLGTYIQAGSFAHRSAAEELNDQLREQGLDARVLYLRVRN